MENELNSLQQALLRASQHFGKIVRSATNPYHGSKYADLNTIIGGIRKALADEGVLLTQGIEVRDGRHVIITAVWLGTTSMTSEMMLPDIQDCQKLGSAVTYFRRYTLVSLLALQTEADDDAQSIYQSEAVEVTPPAPTVSQTTYLANLWAKHDILNSKEREAACQILMGKKFSALTQKELKALAKGLEQKAELPQLASIKESRGINGKGKESVNATIEAQTSDQQPSAQ